MIHRHPIKEPREPFSVRLNLDGYAGTGEGSQHPAETEIIREVQR